MGDIIFITGGGRSGKSSYAQRLAESLPGPRLFLATAVPFDQELENRISRHRTSRREDLWPGTTEEPYDVARAIREAAGYSTILVDCLTVWVGNLMWVAENGGEGGGTPTENDVAAASAEIVSACREHEGTVVLVSNEVGLGIIPENPAARLYRDLLGRCNQVVATAAGTFLLMVSGLPITLKGQSPPPGCSP
jgi:adenosylcobinamide kinase / adenosylcobinamide-phosphate guanylyltransferase